MPNAAVPNVTLSILKFGWLKMLKKSARNWMPYFSANGKSFITKKSQSCWKGPRTWGTLRPRFPNAAFPLVTVAPPIVNEAVPGPPKEFSPVSVVPGWFVAVGARTDELNAPVVPAVKFSGDPDIIRLPKLPTTFGNVELGVRPKRLDGQLPHPIVTGSPDWNVVKPPIAQ